ncbi:hypothetical protein Tco_0105305 [Tanacetum coccineum]
MINYFLIVSSLSGQFFFLQTGGRSKKCFKEITSSLKCWKKKFFLIDRRAIPDAMPWRHTDTDLRDDFPTYYSESEAARLAEFVVPLRPPPRHLLYMCGLTTACRHPEPAYNIKDRDRNDQRPKPRTTSPLAIGEPIPENSSFQKNLEKPNPKIFAAREKNKAKALAKLQAKRAGKGALKAPRNKRKVCPNQEPDHSGLEKTLSPTPLYQAAPQNKEEPATAATVGSTGGAINVENEVVDLSGNTRAPTPPATAIYSSPHLEHTASNACKELVSHLETLVEEEFLGNLINAEVRELMDRLKNMEKERNDWIHIASDQVEKIRSLEETLVPKSRQLVTAEERIWALENKKAYLETRLAQADVDHQQLVREFIPTMVKRLHTSVEYQKSLAAPVSLCFTAGWLNGLSLGRTKDQIATMMSETRDLDIKFADSYHLLIADLMKFSPDVPPSPTNETGTSTAEETIAEATFGTTT